MEGSIPDNVFQIRNRAFDCFTDSEDVPRLGDGTGGGGGMQVLIAGGGIGGLAAALCLHLAGVEVTVFEAAAALRPLGVGINLLPHAVRILTHLGLGSRLAEAAVATAELVYCNKFGRPIWREPRGLAAGYPDEPPYLGPPRPAPDVPVQQGAGPARPGARPGRPPADRVLGPRPPGGRRVRRPPDRGGGGPRRRTSWSGRTASIRPCGGRSIRAGARPGIPAGCFGGASASRCRS